MECISTRIYSQIRVSTTLSRLVRKARHVREGEKELDEAYNILLEGVIQFLHRQGALDENGGQFTKSRLVDALEVHGIYENFQNLLLDLCLSSNALNSQYWDSVTINLINLPEALGRGNQEV